MEKRRFTNFRQKSSSFDSESVLAANKSRTNSWSHDSFLLIALDVKIEQNGKYRRPGL